MGWVLEVVSFLVAADSPIFLLSDIWNCLQGVLIFILLIMRRRVFRLIKERFIFFVFPFFSVEIFSLLKNQIIFSSSLNPDGMICVAKQIQMKTPERIVTHQITIYG